MKRLILRIRLYFAKEKFFQIQKEMAFLEEDARKAGARYFELLDEYHK